ncbi:putative CyP450 monooxygenase [Neolentinus lepideus HHB14362 ss-1]|uniref:Putative CyP450 monooxygenase n=1 Tax=Neolentinus lepideus HHB14362 ss-1 TaxID=1314782 RepID=A0A165M991_9AGAM|nr:putative CyP450 monooxygenase [Neolentinus lepideus HHB14362 ss-1]
MVVSLLANFAILCLFAVFLKVYLLRRSSNPSGLPYPPGPKPLPLIGNLLDIPRDESGKVYAAWGRQYGELIHFTSLGVHYVVINSMRVAVDLLEKRSKKYSHRPNLPLVNMLAWDFNFALKPYGEAWRQRRREFHQQFRAEKTMEYHPKVLENAHKFLKNILAHPENFAYYIRHYPGSTVMSVVYDYEVAPENDYFVNVAETSVDMLSESTNPGAALVNVLPILQHIPAWLPGMEFKRWAQKGRDITMEMINAPLRFVRNRLDSGVPTTCVTTELIERLSDSRGRLDSQMETVVRDVAGIAYAAGADTTVAAIRTSFLAMILYPEETRKAQMEINNVVGSKRLPTFDDRSSLPYVEAFFREVLRWHPVLPLSVGRAAYEDDIYEGQFIPAGANVIMNTWALHHDENIYPEPHLFRPERFFDPNGSLSDRYPFTAFGMGRRICPGRHLADATVWAAIALVVAVFDIKKCKDEAGNDIDVLEDYQDGLVSHPKPFVCSIKPRNSHAESLICDSSDIA